MKFVEKFYSLSADFSFHNRPMCDNGD